MVFVTQVIDPADPVLGFTVDLVRALSPRFERLTVIANRVEDVPDDLGAEVISLGKERGAGRFLRGLRYERALADVVRRTRPHALLAHMCPVYLNIAAPLCKASGVRLLLWFAHPANSSTLAIAQSLADRVLTPFPGTYPRKSSKVRSIGQGIDVGRFPLLPARSDGGPFRLLAVGRTSPVKDYPTLVRAIRILRDSGVEARFVITGPSTTPQEIQHRREIEDLISRLDLRDWVTLEAGVSHDRVPDRLRDADALVSGTIQGSGDKAVIEAMSAGRPVLVSNPVFEPLLEGVPAVLTFREGDPEQLADRIRMIAATSAEVRDEIGRALRQRVERDHSISRWSERILETVMEFDESKHASERVGTGADR